MDFKTLSALPLIFFAGAAFAEPATPEGAAHLTGVLQTYLGSTAGVVTVTPEGDAYTVTLDAAPLIALVPQGTLTAAMSPMVLRLTDNGDGTWGMTQDQAFSLKLSVPGALELSMDMASVSGEGVFDEALQSFSSMSGRASGMTLTETVTEVGVEATKVYYALDEMSFESSSEAGENGTVDSASSYAMSGLNETVTMPMPGIGEGMVPIEIGVTVESYTMQAAMVGYRPDAIYGLLAWVVAHPSEAAMMADKAGLKALLKGGIPFFATMGGDGTANNIVVTTPFGPIGIAEMGISVEANGVVADGMLREAFSLSGLTLPDGMLPPWAEPLLPQEMSLDVTASNFDLAAPAAILLGMLDLADGAEPDPMLDQMLLAALLPDGVVDITLAATGLSNEVYDLTMAGEMSAGPASMPTGTATVTLDGIDAVLAALNAAPDDIKGQILPMIGMAQGMATTGGQGELVWEIDASQPGTLLVNGTDMLGMGGSE